MTYFEEIRELTKLIPATIVDFSQPRDRTSPPTQASSNFITNKEQGDWAEDLIFRAINETSDNYIAVRYGKSDDLIAGEEGFDQLYNDFQDELDTIGKRPDLLVFKKQDVISKLGYDISEIIITFQRVERCYNNCSKKRLFKYNPKSRRYKSCLPMD